MEGEEYCGAGFEMYEKYNGRMVGCGEVVLRLSWGCDKNILDDFLDRNKNDARKVSCKIMTL